MLEQFFSDARIALTVVSFLTFVGIILWAYSGRREAAFAAAANLPFADEIDMEGAEKHHG
ncbi:cbb3-type cytochrome oxidase subunit 3 [Noviherbaspirillum galbum]|uniref:CcoQ/FixQ family Cbb3-type cytochrome c oxidase assembly chaperone n=1 Tax=Noviherbaspirillum galbum TaxID=2709383 RepID=A0A6B3SN94_9BURK|nr:CcoQ/FixQ family Cbb3-type cytochrome c oxidase assembly chaperone [Noviherbaspirillum galbum]NEX62284.1 CcoQ/FixQ family Cbb3-type cytochrome c oxidase assembly chaperone [Noviherbaspirillum galbum]